MSDSKMFWYTSSSGRIEFQLPIDAVIDCSHSGPCDSDVEYWQPKLKLNLGRSTMITELLEFGAWDIDELNRLTNDELEQKFIWIAAGDIQESDEYRTETKETENE